MGTGRARNPWLTSLVAALLENDHVPPVVPGADEGPFTLADPEANRVLLANTGFTHVRVEEITGVMDFADVEDYFSLQSSVGGPIAPFVASLTNAQRETITASLGPILEPFRRDEQLSDPLPRNRGRSILTHLRAHTIVRAKVSADDRESLASVAPSTGLRHSIEVEEDELAATRRPQPS